MEPAAGFYAEELNRRKFCVHFSIPAIIETTNTPNWIISPDKPGLRKLTQKAKEEDRNFYLDNPDFLEVV
jgi:hypothetical protein